MRSLFLKIFLWFWLTVVLVGVTLVVTTIIARSNNATDAEGWKASVAVAVSGEATRAVDIYERGGPAALKKHFDQMQRARFMYLYLLDERGKELLDQQPPRQAVDLALTAGKDAPLLPSYPGSDRFAAQRVTGARGRDYYFVLITPGVPIKSLFESMGLEAILGLIGVLLVAGVFCFWLARHITAPVLELREAASQIADGHLNSRVSSTMHKRRDEIGVLGQDFDRMAAQIESLVASQQRLLSTVSHELRSPLTRLTLAASLLRRCPPQETSEYLDRIELETEQLDRLIAQLLTLARIESSADSRQARERIDLASLLQEIAVNGNFEARTRPCIVCLGPVEPCVTTGVTDQIRRAIENVVRNAIRYTKAHSQVEISMRRQGAPPATALIQVRDYGPGVPQSDLQNIFRPFYRVISADGPSSDGSGLGLAITERIVGMHGGTVRAANAADGGLLVELQLPLHA